MRLRLTVVLLVVASLLAATAPRIAYAAIAVTQAELKDTQLILEGSGAMPNAGISVDGVLMGQSDSGGRFKIQRDPFSSATCVVTISDGAASARATLSGCTPTATPTPSGPSAPAPLAPANGGSLAEPLTISWSAVTDPAGINLYVWEVSASTTFRPVATQGFTNSGTTQDKVSGLPNGTYFWHVKVINGAGAQSAWSAARSFTITGQAPGTPGAPAFTAPANLAQFHPSEFFTFSWTAVSGAASYRVEEDATDATFSAPEVTTANINGTSLNTGFGFVGTIYARVRAVAADGTLGLPSPTVQVTITYSAPIPPPPSPVGPANGAQVTLPVTFDWTDDPNPQIGGYELQIARDSAFTGDCGTIELCVRGITPSQYTLTSLTSGTKFWRVRSYHGDASPTAAAVTAWSAVRSLTVQATSPSLVSFTIDVYGQGGLTLRSHTNAFSGTTADNMAFGTVQLSSPAPAGGGVVALSSSNTAVATLPASITVPAGSATASFRIEPMQVTASTTVTLTASLGGQSVSAPLTVDPSNLRRLDIGNGFGAVTVLGGSTPSAFVVFNGLAPAGSVVSLSSSNPAAATVPASLSVNADSASGSFTITTSNVAASTVVTITATWKGQSVQSQLTVEPAVAPTLLGPADGATFTAGQTITWDWNNVAGASTYTFQISDNSAFTSFVWNTSTGHPVSQATLPAGTMYWRVQAVDGFGFAGPWSAVRSFTNGAGVTLSGLTLSPLGVTGGASSQGTVALSGPAPGPFNGALVALSSSNPSAASVPTSVKIAAGAGSATFTVTTRTVTASTPVVISASFLGTTRTATLTVNPPGG
jgi:hypothetical protein